MIDEGQEFSARQLEALMWLLDDPENSPLYVFADPYQHSGLFTTDARDRFERKISFRWQPPVGSEKILLTMNCRNSEPIAELAAQFYPEAAPRALVSGPAPQFHFSQPADVAVTAARLTKQLVEREGFRCSQIMVIAVAGETQKVDKALRHGGLGTVHVAKLYRFPLTTKDLRIVVATPDDAQGLEADAVVVMDSHSDPLRLSDRDLYVAMSRARSVLHIVSPLHRDDLLEGARRGSPEASSEASMELNSG